MSGRHRARHRRPYAVLPVIAVVVLIAAAVIGGVELAHSLHGTESAKPPVTAPISATVAAAAQWATTNLDHSNRLLTGAADAAALVGKGYPAGSIIVVRSPHDSLGPCSGYDFVLATASFRSVALPASAAGTCLASSSPVAVFGSGGDGASMQQIAKNGLPALQQGLAADHSARLLAGTALLRNPRLLVDPRTRAVLAAGSLDLRAATFLPFLGQSTTVQVLSTPQDAAEAAAKLPVRTIDLSVSNADAMTMALAGPATDYEPQRITRLPSGAFELVWPVRLAPVAPLN